MKHLLPLILACALLCGCGRGSIPDTTLPTEAAASLSATDGTQLPGDSREAVQFFPLTIRKVRGMRTLGENLLLFSGRGSTTLTLLSRDHLTVLAQHTLEWELDPRDTSLRIHPEGTVSFFDPGTQETVQLDGALQELRRIAAPGALSGTPILSDDGRTLYYCTASDLRAWDLDTGIRRCVKKMSFPGQSLVNVLGTVLQCRIPEEDTEHSLFLSGENGQLLHEGKGAFHVMTRGSRYYADIPAGFLRIPVFGSGSEAPMMLVPEELSSAYFFLPEQEGVTAVSTLGDSRLQLEYYSLETGFRHCVLTLDCFHTPSAVEPDGTDAVYILFYDPLKDQDVLCRWDVRPEDRGADNTHLEVYHSAQAPDTDGLAQCQAYADTLSQKYGIHILLGRDAAAVKPWDYDLEPEHLTSVLRRELELLDRRLSRYPDGMLEATASHFNSLNICILRSLTGTGEPGSLHTATGVQFLDGADAYVAIAAGQYSEQALYHELFHVMETHIFSESTAFDQWESLNPAGFQYDYSYAANARRDSGVYLLAENRAFVDTYSMSFPKEDRARIMEYAMLPGHEDLFLPPRMQNKLQSLCLGIREAYGLEDHGEALPWEQYLQ